MHQQQRNILALSSAATIIGAIGAALAAPSPPSYIMAAVESVGRPPDDKARDNDRKPAETVMFAGVKPGDKVLELEPARGYYTRILSKVVGPGGKVYAVAFQRPGGRGAPPMAGAAAPPRTGAAPQPAAAPGPGGQMRPAAGAPRNPIDSVYRLSRSNEFGNIMPILGVTMGASGSVGLPDEVDVAWTSDNYHDFHNKSFGPLNMLAINKSIFRDLKPGGIYLVIDHATAPGAGTSQTETLHRIDPEAVKKEVLAAGFVFDGRSNVLAHPADNHTRRVFDLKGKADDFVLRFRKPLNAKTIHRLPDSALTPYYGNTLVLGTPEQRMRTIFYHPDHTYQEFGQDGITNGIWYLDIDGNDCMVHQTERAGAEGTVACRPLDFPASKHPHAGDAKSAAQTGMMAVALMKGHVYPNATMPMPP